MERFFILHEGHPRQVMLKLDHYGGMPAFHELFLDCVIVSLVVAIIFAGIRLWAA